MEIFDQSSGFFFRQGGKNCVFLTGKIFIGIQIIQGIDTGQKSHDKGTGTNGE